MMFLRNNNKLIISTKMIYKFIKKIGFSRKRVKTIGTFLLHGGRWLYREENPGISWKCILGKDMSWILSIQK
jgi:hypothetical protein